MIPFTVRRIELIAYLRGTDQRLIERQWSLQRGAIDVLHHQKIRTHVVERSDVRMIQPGDGPGFAPEAVGKRSAHTLIATSRPSRLSRAFHTSPVPTAPARARIS